MLQAEEGRANVRRCSLSDPRQKQVFPETPRAPPRSPLP